MPSPRLIENRRVWDIDELDIAFSALPKDHKNCENRDLNSGSWADYK
jgi:hypothetical protein